VLDKAGIAVEFASPAGGWTPYDSIKLFKFEQVNEYLELMRAGEVVGRAVMKF
jgi:hypothetical protein